MTLKVKDLIEELKKHDPEMIVICRDLGYCKKKVSLLRVEKYVERNDSGTIDNESDYNYAKEGIANKQGGAKRFEKKYGTNTLKDMLFIS